MRYYAMIHGERRGPYELKELSQAGVRPDTYVWCKGMDDWEKAEDVADICRYYRQTLYDKTHGGSVPAVEQPTVVDTDNTPGADDPYKDVPLRFRNMVRKSGEAPPEFISDEPDLTRPPMPTLIISLFLTLFCFPFTGLVAVYYSFKARQSWAMAEKEIKAKEKSLYSDTEIRELKEKAHEYGRQAKMWVGITFFLGLILYALLGHKFL